MKHCGGVFSLAAVVGMEVWVYGELTLKLIVESIDSMCWCSVWLSYVVCVGDAISCVMLLSSMT